MYKKIGPHPVDAVTAEQLPPVLFPFPFSNVAKLQRHSRAARPRRCTSYRRELLGITRPLKVKEASEGHQPMIICSGSQAALKAIAKANAMASGRRLVD